MSSNIPVPQVQDPRDIHAAKMPTRIAWNHSHKFFNYANSARGIPSHPTSTRQGITTRIYANITRIIPNHLIPRAKPTAICDCSCLR